MTPEQVFFTNDYFIAQAGPPMGAHGDSSLTSIAFAFRGRVLGALVFTAD